MRLALLLVIGAAMLARGVQASQHWNWSYQGPEVNASGTFTTTDTANADGFYEITGITGEANGVPITGLQATGTSMPGNDGYPVDNLVGLGSLQLTKNGFAFALANGTYANPFYGKQFSPPGYYAFLSDPAAGRSSEPSISFTAAIVH